MEIPKASVELQKRIISAGILAPVIISIVWMGGGWFSTLVTFGALIMMLEWHGIINSGKKEMDEKLHKKWLHGGIAYVGLFASSLIYLRNLEDGRGVVMLILLIVWATDIAAYFTGRMVKGPKICPKISPSKTWSGLAGGMVAAAFVGAFASVFTHSLGMFFMIILCAFLAVVSQAGDFFESWVKRQFDVKDSGNIIPGHGGLMDRVDGLTTVVPIFAVISFLNGGNFF